MIIGSFDPTIFFFLGLGKLCAVVKQLMEKCISDYSQVQGFCGWTAFLGEKDHFRTSARDLHWICKCRVSWKKRKCRNSLSLQFLILAKAQCFLLGSFIDHLYGAVPLRTKFRRVFLFLCFI